jgi:hypothetical protein
VSEYLQQFKVDFLVYVAHTTLIKIRTGEEFKLRAQKPDAIILK